MNSIYNKNRFASKDFKLYKIAKLSPYIASENVGDAIIADYCQDILTSIFGNSLYVDISTRDLLSKKSRIHIATSDYSIVCGTNLLASNMNRYRQWNIRITDLIKIFLNDMHSVEHSKKLYDLKRIIQKDKLILLGVGWWQYQETPNTYTKKLLKLLLHEHDLHSVRDSYTKNMLAAIGIHNVLNTACPTMWGLTENFCKEIPRVKGKNVITTFTDYHQSLADDQLMLDILTDNYEKVFIWLQSLEDLDYLKHMKLSDKLIVLPPNLKAYDAQLMDKSESLDYIGTRLHGGIRALNHKVRSVIIAVDNRAAEIAKDTNLPVILRNEIGRKLQNWIDRQEETQIMLPTDNINRWKTQFSRARKEL